jgi:hypothetical protein
VNHYSSVENARRHQNQECYVDLGQSSSEAC